MDFLDIYRKRPGETISIAILIIVFFIWLFFRFACSVPKDFPTQSLFSIKNGETLQEVSLEMTEKKYVCSSFWLMNFVILFGGDGGVKAGDYYFEKKQGVVSVAYRISNSDYRIPTKKITIPEGLNNREVAELLKSKLPKFDAKMFLMKAEKLEGFLFPDTYSFPENATESDVITAMNTTFGEKIKSLDAEIKKFGKPLRDIIVMASLVEEEVRTYETRQKVAGILWKRLSIGMPLQVDAVFPYIAGKKMDFVSFEDLKIESPYNTYLNKGLPPGPIANPGLSAIRATINPVKTSYFYYLTDKEGNMHYAVTLAQHVGNKERYLRP